MGGGGKESPKIALQFLQLVSVHVHFLLKFKAYLIEEAVLANKKKTLVVNERGQGK